MMDAYLHEVETALDALCTRYAAEIEGWLREQAGEQPESALVRVEVSRLAGELVIGWQGEADAELGETGRYARIAPALDYFAPRFAADLRRIFA